MSRLTRILLIIFAIVVIGYIAVNVYNQYQQNIKYDKTAEEFEKSSRNKDNQIKDLKKDLADKNDLINRQSKDVIADEEKEIRETTNKFVKAMLEQKPKTDFVDKKDDLKPLMTDKYFNSLFKKYEAKYNLYGDSTVESINVYMDEFKPENNKYAVFVEFEEKEVDIEDGNKEVKKKGSGKVTLERVNKKWKVSSFERFALDPTSS
ncbi:TPA: hypothetical protein O6L53_002727 [Staphylococcus aureus]|nr:hypothetical protein [Staphylococcus aureus]HDB3143321.1 hypothetical protein [Staphylococcus aureus]HDE8374454.1 hypothetical protein [Staphylococcus aureus]